MKGKTARPAKFRVGDWAVWTAGQSRNPVQIVEDVGPVGRSGERYYRYRSFPTPDDPMESEMAERYLELARPDEAAAAQAAARQTAG